MFQRLGKNFFHPAFGVMAALILGSFIYSCRVAPPQRAKVWSVRTAEAFAKMVKQGRKVAVISGNEKTVRGAVSKGFFISGMRVFASRRDSTGDVIVFAQFDPRETPAVSVSVLEAFAHEVVQKAANDLRIDPLELRMAPMTAAKSNERIISFTREISGSPLRDSRLSFVFSEMGGMYHLTEIRNRTWGNLKAITRVASEPLTDSRIGDVISDKGAKIQASGHGYKVDERSRTPQLVPTTWYDVQASDGEIFTLTFTGGIEPRLIEAYSHQVNAVLEASVYKRSWTGGREFQTVPDAWFAWKSGSRNLDSSGNLPPDTVSGQIKLISKWARVRSESGSSNTTGYNISQDGGRIVVRSSGESDDANINVYLAINRIRNYVKRFYKPGEVRYFDRQLMVTTNIQKTCNAFYMSATLNFFHRGTNDKGRQCGNMALVNDVIYHEWGHGLDDYTGPGSEIGNGMSDAAFSEGIGDTVGMFFVGDSALASGFFADEPSTPLRNLDNNKVYVAGVEDEIHEQGTIVGGAFWELRKRMINKYGEAGKDKAAELFFRHLLEAETYLDSYDIIQRLADDDNNPATRHEDWCVVNHAFALKGLAPRDACTDDFGTNSPNSPTLPPSPGPSAAKVFFALGDASGSGATPLYVSAAMDGARSVSLCGGTSNCPQPLTIQIQRSQAGVAFFGPISWDVTDGQTINAQVLDGSGSEIARRIVKFRKR